MIERLHNCVHRLLFLKTDRRISGRRPHSDSIRELDHAAGGVCSDQIGTKASPEEYIRNLTNSKFSLSPIGGGKQCYRDTDIIVAGGVPVLDGYLSGGPTLYDENVPVIHAPMCKNQNYCDLEKMTKSWFESEYAKLEARRDELSVSKSVWPYWLYHVFLPVPARPDRQSSHLRAEINNR